LSQVLNTIRHVGLVVTCLALLTACGINSTIKHSYVNPQIDGSDLKGVLVVAVSEQKATRKEFQDAFVRSFGKRGITAVASYTMVPNPKAEAEEVIVAAKDANLDTILVTRYVGESIEEVYHPGTTYYGVMPVYHGNRYGRFGGYYGHAYEVAHQQPVWSANHSYTLISDLFATDSRAHLWQAVTDTIQSGSEGKLRDDIVSGFKKNCETRGCSIRIGLSGRGPAPSTHSPGRRRCRNC